MGTEGADIRFATTDTDREAIYRLRYELYVEGQGLFADEADHERRWLTDDYDPVSLLGLAEVDGEVVGTMRMTFGADTAFSDETRQTYELDRFRKIVDERDIAVGTRLLVRPEYRGSVIVFQMLWKGFERLAQRDVELFLGNCEPHLVNHYHKLGFRPYGGLYNHATNGALVRLMIAVGDDDYLRSIDSPMRVPLSQRTTPARAVQGLRDMLERDTSVVTQVHDGDQYWGEVIRWLGAGDTELRSLMSDLSHGEATVLLAKSQIMTTEPGTALIRKGHVSRTLYVLLSGALEVIDDGAVVARVDKPGSVVGEVAFFAQRQRMSDVIAGPDGARVLALSDRVLREIISSHGPVAAKFLHFVARGLCAKLLERAQG